MQTMKPFVVGLPEMIFKGHLRSSPDHLDFLSETENVISSKVIGDGMMPHSLSIYGL